MKALLAGLVALLIPVLANAQTGWDYDIPGNPLFRLQGSAIFDIQNNVIRANRQIRGSSTTYITGPIITWNLAAGQHSGLRLGGDWSVVVTNLVSAVDVTLLVRQVNGGGWTLTWPPEILWAGGIPPVMCQVDNCVDVFSFIVHNGATELYETGRTLDLK